MSRWFSDLCSGVYGGSPKAKGFGAAYAAFAEMGPEAVPYLAAQLQFDRSQFRETLLLFLRDNSLTQPLTVNAILPSEHRNYAAVALRRMGSGAESAIPAFLDTWAHGSMELRVNVVAALESILFGRSTDGASPAEWRAIEAAAINEAVRRYPAVAAELRIRPIPPE